MYFSLSVAVEWVIRDSRGKVKTNNSWKSQIITPANSGSDIRLGGHVGISGRGGEGGSGGLISSQPIETVTWYRHTGESKA